MINDFLQKISKYQILDDLSHPFEKKCDLQIIIIDKKIQLSKQGGGGGVNRQGF